MVIDNYVLALVFVQMHKCDAVYEKKGTVHLLQA